MKVQTYVTAVILAGLFAFGPTAMAADQGSSGSASGPAAGDNVTPQTGTAAGGNAGVTGLRGSKSGPTGRTGDASGPAAGENVRSPPGGATKNAAGVAGPAGSKNGPPQRSGSSDTQK